MVTATESERILKSFWQQAEIKAEKLYKRFVNVMSTEFGIEIWNWTANYKLGLLTLDQMAEKNGLTFEEVSQVLVDYFLKMKGRRSKRKDRMPVRLDALTGEYAQKVLRYYIAENYPGGEQWSLRLEELVDGTLGESVIYQGEFGREFATPDEFTEDYLQHIKKCWERDNEVRTEYLRRPMCRGSYGWILKRGRMEAW